MSVTTYLAPSIEGARIDAAIEAFSKSAEFYSEPRPDYLLEPQFATIFHLYIDEMCLFPSIFSEACPVLVRLIEVNDSGEAHYILTTTESQEDPHAYICEMLQLLLPDIKKWSQEETQRLERMERFEQELKRLEKDLETARIERMKEIDKKYSVEIPF